MDSGTLLFNVTSGNEDFSSSTSKGKKGKETPTAGEGGKKGKKSTAAPDEAGTGSGLSSGLQKSRRSLTSQNNLYTKSKDEEAADKAEETTKIKVKPKAKGKPRASGEKDVTPFFSNIFHNNPDIPEVHLSKVKEKEEQVLTEEAFSNDNGIHPHIIGCMKERLGVTEMTRVQQLSLPILLKGHDCLIKSVTGSGKTLAYSIPIVHDLQAVEPKIKRLDGIYALVLVPTRELAIQTFETISLLCKACVWIVPGCLMGGENKNSEKARIRKGINILITTPGRLLDHIEHTANLVLSKLRWLVIDEADRLHDQGFEEIAAKIISRIKDTCDKKPQTVLLSATLTKGVERLAGMSLVNPETVDASDQDMEDTSYVLPPHLKQHFVIVPAKLRLITLCSFITSKCARKDLKAILFMMTQDEVEYHYTLFNSILNPMLKSSDLKDVSFFRLYGNMDQPDRVKVFSEFRESRAGILLCTDVAARGLDLPKVDWILQYSCAPKAEDYVHRVGRTARIGLKGNALQFLLPSETKFLEVLHNHLQINLENMDGEELIKSILLIHMEGKSARTGNVHEYASHLHGLIEDAVNDDPDLLDLAKKAYLAFSRGYASYPKTAREVIPFKELHLGHLAKSFCLRESPQTLGAYGANMRQPRYEKRFEGRGKRKVPNEFRVSEFGSGLGADPDETHDNRSSGRGRGGRGGGGRGRGGGARGGSSFGNFKRRKIMR